MDPNWWKVVGTSDEAVVGGLPTYVDDFLLAGSKVATSSRASLALVRRLARQGGVRSCTFSLGGVVALL